MLKSNFVNLKSIVNLKPNIKMVYLTINVYKIELIRLNSMPKPTRTVAFFIIYHRPLILLPIQVTTIVIQRVQ
jgi:hypothetical protein